MKRLRIALLLLALGIALPATLIVLRASETLDLENAYRHEAVAERLFDEMERSLSELVLRESARPASDYRDLPREPVAAGALSPRLRARFDALDWPFVIGWFAVDGAGAPRLLVADASDRTRVATALARALAGSDGGLAERALASPSRDRPEPAHLELEDAAESAAGPAPGRTRSIGRKRLEKKELADLDDQPAPESSTYELLQSLNRAGSRRSERQSKALEQRAAPAPRAQEAFDAAPSAALADARPTSGSRREDAFEADFEEATRGVDALESDDAGGLGAVRTAAEAALPVVDPLIGRTTGDDTIVLTRTVWRGVGGGRVGGQVERQGLVIDQPALVEWLREQVLANPLLAERATLRFAPSESTPAGNGSDHRYLHRFAEPFEHLLARLDLEPLPGLETARSLYTLALLLAIALALGLFAVERTTRVVVEYAQRRSDFVAAVSHELKTPLTSIRMYGEMLRDGLVASDAKRAEYHATITDEAERLSRLIDNVLELSRLDEQRRDFVLVEGDLGRTVVAAVDKLRAHAERAGFVLDLALPADLPRVAHDGDAVTQIVFNLCDNAIKYAGDADEKRIEIELVAGDGSGTGTGGDAVELRVRDFGPGVPEAEQTRIFEPFYRIGDELTRTAEGTGIGLALVRDLARGMGGSVRAETPAGGGLRVVVSLGRAAASSDLG